MSKHSSIKTRIMESKKFLLKYHSVENKVFGVAFLSGDNMKTR